MARLSLRGASCAGHREESRAIPIARSTVTWRSLANTEKPTHPANAEPATWRLCHRQMKAGTNFLGMAEDWSPPSVHAQCRPRSGRGSPAPAAKSAVRRISSGSSILEAYLFTPVLVSISFIESTGASQVMIP